MLTVDDRCTMRQCEHKNGIYRMVGHCSNCGTTDILILITETHEARPVDCPVCGVYRTVRPDRLATDDEFPESRASGVPSPETEET